MIINSGSSRHNDSDMKQLKGISLAQLDFIPEHLGDLLYQEGPVLAHFVNKDNPSDHYIYRWTDMNDNCNRWLVIKVTEKQLFEYLSRQTSLLQLIQSASFVYFLDLGNDLHAIQIVLTPIADVPPEYLPGASAYFDENQFEPYATELRNRLKYKIPFDLALQKALGDLLKEYGKAATTL